MEPQSIREFSSNKTWEEIRELDEVEKWRDRNAIITKHEHKQSLTFLRNFVEKIVDNAMAGVNQEPMEEITHSPSLPDSNTVEFESIIEASADQKSESNLEAQFQVMPSDNDFKPASDFDFELSYFEQIGSSEDIKYIPRGSLFRTFDPLVSSDSPVLKKDESKVKPVPVIVPNCDPLPGEVNPEMEVDYRESTGSFCSCQNPLPDEVSGDGLTSGDEYDSTHEDSFVDVIVPETSLKVVGAERMTSPIHTSISESNNADNDSNNGTIDGLQSELLDTSQDQNTPTLQKDQASGQSFLIGLSEKQEFQTADVSNEVFRPSHEVDLALEFLEGLDIVGERDLPRESLFTRFDPLTQQSIPPTELLRRSSQLSDSSQPPNTNDTTGKCLENANLLTFATPPKSQHITPGCSSTKLLHSSRKSGNVYTSNPLSLNKSVNNIIIPVNPGATGDEESRSLLRYTESEVRAITRGDRGRVRLEVRKRKKEKEEVLARERIRLLALLESERKRRNDMMKEKEGGLHRVKDDGELYMNSIVCKWAVVDGQYQAAKADLNLLRAEKELLNADLSESGTHIKSMQERSNELLEDTERLEAKKCKVISELENMSSTRSNFETKIIEANESILQNLSRINELIVKIDSTAKTSGENEKRFFLLEDRAMVKLKDANKMHEGSSKQYNQEMLLLRTQIRTKKMQLSDLHLEIQKLESENKSLQGIAQEMMAQHQPSTK